MTTPQQGDAQDEVKRRFREALERKQGRQADKVDGDEAAGGAKVHQAAHGPAKNQKSFRRKSG